MMDLFPDKKEVLTVGATGALGFEAALRGAEKVDMFDINILQRMYFEIMKAAIKVFPYEKFMQHFTLREQCMMMDCVMDKDLYDLLSRHMFETLKNELPQDVRYVFEQLYNKFDPIFLIKSGLYNFEHFINRSYLSRIASFYNESEYMRLQNIIRSNPNMFNYFNCSLTDLPNKCNSKYDLIMLDNILLYYKQWKDLNSPEKVDTFIKDDLSNLLHDDGTIQVNYGFKFTASALERLANMPWKPAVYDEWEWPIQKLYELEVDMAGRAAVDIPLLGMEGYQCQYIPGSELGYDNSVLTYSRKL